MGEEDEMSGDRDHLNGLDARISIRGYFERIMREQQEALRVAETEREKSAANVRLALEDNMKVGDDRLQDHITHQIESVRSALTALTALMVEKEGRLDDRFKSQDKASDLALKGANEAIKVAKAESKERLDAHNGLIDKMEALVNTFPTRKELEALSEKDDAARNSANEKLDALRYWQARIGGMAVIVLVIGVTNFVKIWTN